MARILTGTSSMGTRSGRGRRQMTYRPWEGLRLRFYIEDIVRARDDLKRQMELANVPIRHEWDWECYQPLPLPLIDPVHKEPPEFDLYAISFKEIQINFAETFGNPWINDIVYRDPVHTTFLLNTKTATARGNCSRRHRGARFAVWPHFWARVAFARRAATKPLQCPMPCRGR